MRKSAKTDLARRYDVYLYKRGMCGAGLEKKAQKKVARKKREEPLSEKRQIQKMPNFVTPHPPDWRTRQVSIEVFVYRQGCDPKTAQCISMDFLAGDAAAAWYSFLNKIMCSLQLANSKGLSVRDKDDKEVARMRSLRAGQYYRVIPADGDRLLYAVISATDDQVADESDADFAHLKPAISAGRCALREATEAGFRLKQRQIEAARSTIAADLFLTGGTSVAIPGNSSESLRPSSRAEILKEVALRRDCEEATAVAEMAMAALMEREADLKKWKAICLDPNRSVDQYFSALDGLENESRRGGLGRHETRLIFRVAIRWMATKVLDKDTNIVGSAVARIFRYLDKSGSAEDDFYSLQYACNFFANLALKDNKRLALGVFRSGGLVLSLSIMHALTGALVAESKSICMVTNTNPTRHHPKPVTVHVVKRIASAGRTNEADEEPTSLEVSRLFTRAGFIALELLRNPMTRRVALLMIVQESEIMPLLSIALSRWSAHRHVVRLCCWILKAVLWPSVPAYSADPTDDETKDEKETLISFEAQEQSAILRLLQVAQTRHRDAEEVKRDMDPLLDYLGSSDSRSNCKSPPDSLQSEDRYLGDNVGALELPQLDAAIPEYRRQALKCLVH